MSESLKVVFRKERCGEIVAVFPIFDNHRGHLRVYAHLGQHSAGSLEWYRTTKPASPEEYKEGDEPVVLVPSKRLPPRG